MKKNVNIYIPAGKSVFYANFRMRVHDPKSNQSRTAQVNRSTGSPSRATAQSIANKMRDDALLGLFGVTPKFRSEFATLDTIISRYEERTAVKSKSNVISSFLTVISESNNCTRQAARKLSSSVLTAETMQAFRDAPTAHRNPASTNTHMRMAKSLFSARAREHYRDLKLPDLTDFLGVSFLKDSADKRFRRIPEQILIDMDNDVAKLLIRARKASRDDERHQLRNAWGTYWIMRRCGLRNAECENIRWEWFDHRDGKIWLSLVPRAYWRPKASAGDVPVALDLYESLVAEFGPPRQGPEGFLLAGTLTDRKEGALRLVNTFVRPYLPGRTKAAYELRKQWGSEMARKHGIETAAKLLRHRDISTAWKYYFDDLKLGEVEAL